MDFTEKELQTEVDKLTKEKEHWAKEFTRANQYTEQCRLNVVRLDAQVAQLQEMKTRKAEMKDGKNEKPKEPKSEKTKQ